MQPTPNAKPSHGWTWEQLNFALSPSPACSADDCDDCAEEVEIWRKLRAALGMYHSECGRC